MTSLRGLRLLLGLQALGLVLAAALCLWWSSLLVQKTERVAALELAAAGPLAAEVADARIRTLRMIRWESLAFLALLATTSGAMAWVYIREARRARALHAFFASITHELRTPLTSIRLQAESIADAFSGHEGTARLVRRLLEDTSRLEAQVDRSLELARVEGGGRLAPHGIELSAWFDELLDRERGALPGRVNIRCEVPQGTPVRADPAAMRVVFRNLLDNSVRHSGKNPVSVSIHARRSGQWVVLDYSDDGVGSTEATDRLGRLFHKGPRSSGAGVGLYLVRTLVGRMGGRVAFRSKSGGSSGFGAELRLRPEENA